jgi:hypothetical protein
MAERKEKNKAVIELAARRVFAMHHYEVVLHKCDTMRHFSALFRFSRQAMATYISVITVAQALRGATGASGTRVLFAIALRDILELSLLFRRSARGDASRHQVTSRFGPFALRQLG